MQIKDLRIGNWLLNKGLNIEIEFSQEYFLRFLEYYYDERDFEPIAITEEWLLKFGFKKYNELYFIEIPEQELEITVDLRSNIIVQLCNQTGLIDIHNIQYIHQLQNLFYSITQTELQIK